MPVLKAVKDKVEEVVKLESAKLQQKVWVVVSVSGLTPSQAEEIKELMEENPGYTFIVVSTFPIKSKAIEIESAPKVRPVPVEEPKSE